LAQGVRLRARVEEFSWQCLWCARTGAMVGIWRRGATAPPALRGPAYLANYGEQGTDIGDRLLNGRYEPSDNMRSSRMANEWVIGGGSTKQRMKHPFIRYQFGDDGAVVFEDCFSDSSNEVSTLNRSKSVPYAKLICSTTMMDSSDSDENEVCLHGTNMKFGCPRRKDCEFCHFYRPARRGRTRPCNRRRLEVIREILSERGKADMPCAGFNKLSL